MSVLPTAIAAASGVAKSKVKEMRVSAEYALAVGAAVALGGVFLLVAVTSALALHVGVIYACLIMAALFFAVAGALVMIRKSKVRRAKSAQQAASADALVSTLAKTTDSVSPVGMSMMALAAGYALSKK